MGNFEDVYGALQATKLVTVRDLVGLVESDAKVLREHAKTHRHDARSDPLTQWAQDANLDRATMLSIANNFDWAAGEIEEAIRSANVVQ
jgi:beta-lactamase class D